MPLMKENIQYCATEKSRKTGHLRAKYNEWWLVLVDHIGFGLDDFDREQFRAQVSIQHDWHKIVVVSPNDPAKYFEI